MPRLPEQFVERMWPLLEGEVVVCRGRIRRSSGSERWTWPARAAPCRGRETARIAESCLYRWRQLDLIDRGLEPGTGRAESAELVAAWQKIRDLEEENKILHKAAAAVREVVPQKSGTASWPGSTLTGSASARPSTRWTCRRRATTTGRPGRRQHARSGTPD